MAQVTIDHPDTIGLAQVSQEAFDAIYADLGWVIVGDEETETPDSEQVATVAMIDDRISQLTIAQDGNQIRWDDSVEGEVTPELFQTYRTCRIMDNTPVVNTTTETNMTSAFDFPAGVFSDAGTAHARILMRGTLSNTSGVDRTCIIRVRLEGVAVLTSPAILVDTGVNAPQFTLEVYMRGVEFLGNQVFVDYAALTVGGVTTTGVTTNLAATPDYDAVTCRVTAQWAVAHSLLSASILPAGLSRAEVWVP